jgi:hypothetical protein
MTQRSLNGTFKLQRSLTGTGILTSVLYGANNLSDVASATQARINLGLTGKLGIDSNSTNYLSISNQFGSTTNETLTVNATVNGTPNTLVAYDINGNVNGNFITASSDLTAQGNIWGNTLNTLSLNAYMGQTYILLNNDLRFGSSGMHIQDSNGVNALTFDGATNITTNNGLTVNGTLTCGNIRTAGTLYAANLSGNPTNSANVILKSDLKFFASNMHIKDANNNNTLTFDNAGNITLYNTLSINGNSILLNSANTFYIQQQGLVAPGTQPYITIIWSSGNIGIGTSTVSYKLDVGGSIRSTGTIYTDTIQANTTSGSIQFNNGTTTIASIDTNGNFDNSSTTNAGIKTNIIQNPNFTSGPGGVVYKPLVINSNIKWGAANSIIKDVNNNNTITFDNAGNVGMNSNGTFYTNYFDAVANFGVPTTTNTLYFGSNNLSSIVNIQVNSVQNGNASGGLIFKNTSGATTATINEDGSITSSGNVLAPNLHRTIWNQAINSNFSTALGSSFSSSMVVSQSLAINATVAFRLAVPFTWRGETHLFFRVYFQFSSTAPTRYFNLQIWTYTSSTQTNVLTFSFFNPTNYAFYNGNYTLSGLTLGQTYYLTLSDYALLGSTIYTMAGGELTLGNT